MNSPRARSPLTKPSKYILRRGLPSSSAMHCQSRHRMSLNERIAAQCANVSTEGTLGTLLQLSHGFVHVVGVDGGVALNHAQGFPAAEAHEGNEIHAGHD